MNVRDGCSNRMLTMVQRWFVVSSASAEEGTDSLQPALVPSIVFTGLFESLRCPAENANYTRLSDWQ